MNVLFVVYKANYFKIKFKAGDNFLSPTLSLVLFCNKLKPHVFRNTTNITIDTESPEDF